MSQGHYASLQSQWYAKALSALLLSLSIFIVGDRLFKVNFPTDMAWTPDGAQNLQEAFVPRWLAYVGLTLVQTVLGFVVASFSAIRILSLETGQRVFLLVFLMICVLMIGVVPDTQAGNCFEKDCALYNLIGKDLFGALLSSKKLGWDVSTPDLFRASYKWFSIFAALLSTIIIEGFAAAIPYGNEKLTRERFLDLQRWLKLNLNLSAFIVTIGVLQFYVWIRLPAHLLEGGQKQAYAELTRVVLLYYASLFTLVIASGAGVSYFWLRRATRQDSLDWKELLPAGMRPWELFGKIALPVGTALATGFLDNLTSGVN